MDLLQQLRFLFLIVFSLKAGLFLFYWLPGSYSVPPTAIAAIFAALLNEGRNLFDFPYVYTCFLS